MSKKCPESVPECPGHLFDTPGTLWGHVLDTPERGGPKGPKNTLRDTSGPKGPRDSCTRPGGSHRYDLGPLSRPSNGRLIFIHLQCWEVPPFFIIQRQWCIKFRVLGAQDFYTPLALNCQKGQHLPALEVYKNLSPIPSSQKSAKECKRAQKSTEEHFRVKLQTTTRRTLPY